MLESYTMKGLCNKCFSSNNEGEIDEETGELVCNTCHSEG